MTLTGWITIGWLKGEDPRLFTLELLRYFPKDAPKGLRIIKIGFVKACLDIGVDL